MKKKLVDIINQIFTLKIFQNNSVLIKELPTLILNFLTFYFLNEKMFTSLGQKSIQIAVLQKFINNFEF